MSVSVSVSAPCNAGLIEKRACVVVVVPSGRRLLLPHMPCTAAAGVVGCVELTAVAAADVTWSSTYSVHSPCSSQHSCSDANVSWNWSPWRSIRTPARYVSTEFARWRHELDVTPVFTATRCVMRRQQIDKVEFDPHQALFANNRQLSVCVAMWFQYRPTIVAW